MPRLDGIAAAEQIAGQRIAPVVILTAFSQRDLVERARDAGAMAYLVKPFDQNDLVPAIEMAVSRFTELRQLESEVDDLTERLETRKAVDRAKGMLQQSLGLSEPDVVPLDPEDRDGPAALDAPGRRRRGHPRPGHGGRAAGAEPEAGGQRSRTTSSVSSGATSSAGSRSATLTCLRSSSRSATPTSSSPPVAVRALRCASGTKLPSPAPSSGQPALDHHQREHARADAPAERRRERDRGEPVERGLEQQLVGAVAEPLVDRAQDGQRADAEDQRADHEALDEALACLAAAAGPEPAYGGPLEQPTEALQPVLDPQQRPGDAADQHRAQHDQHRGRGADRVAEHRVAHRGGGGAGDQERHQAQTVGDDLAGPLGEAVADQDADRGARRGP